ncbi:N-acetyltransferase [Methanosarcina barkeri]|uniref:GNAT family N-acetyltransferase n=1 Tax=Methanosarcina barkeri TaxID=2208 RepID=UPI00064F9A77|nr:GNAT family N-acetyltransferase [Methanosarcina barkeri]
MNNFNYEKYNSDFDRMLNSDVEVTKARLEEVPQIKSIADKNKNLIGFILRGSLVESIEKENLVVLKYKKIIIGFINYHHRKDSQTTLYEICVDENNRNKGYGKILINYLLQEAKSQKKKTLLLNCPIDGIAHSFYLRCGFKIKSTRTHTKNGKKLVTWVYKLDDNNT